MKKVLVFLMVAVMSISLSLPAFAAPLADVPDTHWAAEAVNMLTELGVLTGYTDQTFRGQQTITRYEVAVSLYRLLVYLESTIAEQINNLGTTSGASSAEVEQLKKELDALRESTASVNDLLTLSGRLSYLESRAGVTPSTSGSSADAAEIEALTKQVDELGKQVTAATLQLIGFTNDVTVLAGKITNVEKELVNLKSADAVFANDLATVNNEIADMKAYLSALTVDPSGEVTVDPTIYNQLLTLSGRLSYLESKYAAGVDVSPAVAADIENLKAEVESLKSKSSVKSADLVSFANDVTVLSNKMMNLEKNVDGIKSTNASLVKDIEAIKAQLAEINAYISSAGAEGNQSVAVDPTIYNQLLTLSGRISFLETKYAAGMDINPEVLAEIENLKAKVNGMGSQTSISNLDMVAFSNDIMVLSNKLASVEKSVDSVQTANTALAGEVAALSSELSTLKAYVSAITVDGAENLVVDPTIYNTLLTLSGRLSYLETKYAAGIEVDPAILAEIESLKNQVNNMGTKNSVNSTDLIGVANDITVLGKRLTAAEVNVDYLQIANSALTNEIAALNEKLSDLESKYAAGIEMDPAILAEIENLKNQVNSMGTKSYVNSAELIGVSNDITVLGKRLTEAEVGVDYLQIAGSAMSKDIATLNTRLSLVEEKVGDTTLSTAISLTSDKIQALESNLANVSKAADMSNITLANDITATNMRIDNLSSQIIALTDNTKAANVEFSNEIAAIQEELVTINAFLDSITGEDLEIISDPRLYNDFLTVSGRVSYIEQKLANATLINPNLEKEVADLKVKLAEIDATANAAVEMTTAAVNAASETVKNNYLGLVIGYDRTSGAAASQTFNLIRISINGKYNFTDRISVDGSVTIRAGKDLSYPLAVPSNGYEIVPEIDVYGRFRAFTFGPVDLGIQAGISSAYSFNYDTVNSYHKLLFGAGLYVDAYVTEKLNIYGDVKFPIVQSKNTSKDGAIDTGFVSAFGVEGTIGVKYDISPSISLGVEGEVSNMPKLLGSAKGIDFNVGVTVGFSF